MISTLPDIFSNYRTTVLDMKPDLYTDISSIVPNINDKQSLYIMPGSDMSISSSDKEPQLYQIPRKEETHKCVNLAPSLFLNGCICGHNIEFRDAVYETRKRKPMRVTGVTIRPKVAPIAAKLRKNI